MGTSFRRGESARPGRDERRFVERAVLFLLMWGTPIAIGILLGSVGSRSSGPSTASGAVHLAQPSR
jgi:hypothetical protein